MTTPKLFPTRNDIPASVREAMIPLLNQQLSDLLDLKSHTKHAHWNVKGPQFLMLHELFDSIAGQLDDYADTVAERAVALGGTAHGTSRQVSHSTRLPEYPATAVDGLAHVAALVERLAAVANSTRAAVRKASEAGDDGTADLFTGQSRDLDKTLWFLESHLNGR